MRTKDMKVCDAVRLEVDCIQNDPESIKNGGARNLGYDFVVPSDNIQKTEKKIKSLLKKYKRPLIKITRYEIKDYNVFKIWSISQIEQCVKDTDLMSRTGWVYV